MRIFVTGAPVHIGSALVPELLGAGHQVLGLARSDSSADNLTVAGAEAVCGSLDVDVLAKAGRESSGVIHLAFKHDLVYTGDMEGAAVADSKAIKASGAARAARSRTSWPEPATRSPSSPVPAPPGWHSSSATARTNPAALIPGLAARRFCWPGPRNDTINRNQKDRQCQRP